MTGFTDRVAQGVLSHVTGKSALFSMPTAYVGLFTAVGTDAGTGFTEVSGGSYARVATAAADWAAAAGTGPSTIQNANSIFFPSPSVTWGNVIAVGLFDAASAGNLNLWDYLGNFLWIPSSVSSASPAVINAKGHGFLAGDTVIWSVEYGGITPTFSASNFTGPLVVTAPITTDTFTVTNSGTPVNTSSTGNGMVRKMATQNIAIGGPPFFPAGAITIRSA